jgi:hypothetical protein
MAKQFPTGPENNRKLNKETHDTATGISGLNILVQNNTANVVITQAVV